MGVWDNIVMTSGARPGRIVYTTDPWRKIEPKVEAIYDPWEREEAEAEIQALREEVAELKRQLEGDTLRLTQLSMGARVQAVSIQWVDADDNIHVVHNGGF